jgi:cadmium resistance protein CadD (predicted permease)
VHTPPVRSHADSRRRLRYTRAALAARPLPSKRGADTAALILGVTVFVATNVDDIFILLALLADPRFRAREVVLGQYLGIGALVLVSVVAALIALVIPAEYIGLLGLAPIALGIKELFESWRGDDDGDESVGDRSAISGGGRVLAVAAITVASGGDNIAVYTPVFAVRSGFEIALIVAVFAVLIAAWVAAAHWLVQHPALGPPVRRYGRRALPIVLIGLGVWILYEAGTINLFRAI